MYFEIIVYAGLIVFITFIVRSLFRFLQPKWGSDVYSHLYFIDEIRKNRHKIPHKLSKTLTSGFFSYPFFVHWCLSFLKKSWVERIEPYFGAIMDTLLNLFLFFSCVLLFGSLGINLEIAFLASLIFSFFPMFTDDDSRTFALSPRVFGSLLFSISTLLLFQFHWSGNVYCLLISLLLIPFILLSSKFAFQVMIFFYPIIALFLKSIWFLFPIPIGIILAIIFSKGLYIQILKTHFRFLAFWKKELLHKYPILLNRVDLGKLFSGLPRLAQQPKEVLKLIYEYPIVRTIAHNPFLIFLVITFFIGTGYPNPYSELLFWIFAGVLTFVAFSFKWLLFLGEAGRYMEYVIVPISILSAYAIINLELYFLALTFFVYSAIVIFMDYRSSLHSALKYGYSEFDEIIGYLNSIPESKNVLVIPAYYTPQVAYFTHHKSVIFSDNLASTNENEKEFLLVFPKMYEYPNNNLDLLAKTFNLDFVVIRKADQNSYNFSNFLSCFENQLFRVYNAKNNQV
jgi:hypothetical protein